MSFGVTFSEKSKNNLKIWEGMGATFSTLMRLMAFCHHIAKPLACQYGDEPESFIRPAEVGFLEVCLSHNNFISGILLSAVS